MTIRDVWVREELRVRLAADPLEVFELMWDPTSTRLWDPSVELAMTLPGTPARQVGEIQTFVHRGPDGRAFLAALEVTRIEWGRLAVARVLTSRLESISELDVTPLGAGCELVQRHHALVLAGTDAEVPELHEPCRELHLAMRTALVERFGELPAG